MGVAERMKTWYYKKRGKPEKIYPVTTAKYRVRGEKEDVEKIQENLENGEEQEIDWSNVNIVFDEFDKGRTIIDEQENRKYFELMNEPQAEGKVNYEDLDSYIQQPFTSILMFDRDRFVPLKKSFETGEQMGDGSGWPKLKYILSVDTYVDWAKEEYQESARIAKNQNEAWWQDRTIQAVMIAIGFGLFYIMAAYGQGQFYLEPMAEQLASHEATLSELMQEGVPGNGG